jgi:hypothetical protein
LLFELLTGAQTEDIYLKIYNLKLAVNSRGIGSKGVLIFERDRQFEKGEYIVVLIDSLMYYTHIVCLIEPCAGALSSVLRACRTETYCVSGHC